MNFPNLPLSVYLVVLVLLLLIGVKGKGKGQFFDNFMDLDITKSLQGFAAVGIILHHLTQKVTQYGQYDKGTIGIMNDCGVLLTGIFLFFSGYGLYTSLLTKEDYLKDFIRKRLPSVLIPFYTTNTIFVVVSLILGYKMKVNEFLLHISGLVLLNSQMWYIVEIVVLYLAFFVIFKVIKNETYALTAMGAFILLLTTISLLLGHDYKYASGGAWFKGEWWYNSTWLFFVGILLAKHKIKVVAFAKKYYAALMTAGIILFALMQKATTYMLSNVGYWTEYEGYAGYKEKFLTCLVQTPTVIIFVLTLLLFTMKVQFHNRILGFLGKIAIELYLIHNIFILYLIDVVKNEFLFYLFVYVGGILLATGIHYMDRWLIKKVSRK